MRRIFRGWHIRGLSAALLAVALLVVGCGHKRVVTGQVFISSKGGENFKLGSVPILVYRAEALQRPISNFNYNAKAVKELYASFCERNTNDAAELNKLNRKHDDLTSQRVQISQQITHIQVQWSPTASYAKMSDANKKQLEDDKAEIKSLIAKRDALTEQQDAVDKGIADFNAKTIAWKNDLHAKASKCEDAMDEEMELIYSGKIPASAVISTDADGKFQFTLEGIGDYCITANAKRLVIDKTETYYWLVDVSDAPSQNILLNNLNMASFDTLLAATRYTVEKMEALR